MNKVKTEQGVIFTLRKILNNENDYSDVTPYYAYSVYDLKETWLKILEIVIHLNKKFNDFDVE